MMFSDYIAEKTVALVGPAAPWRDQSSEIEAHDVVYRVGFIHNVPAQYGQRTDVGFLNGRQGRELYDDQQVRTTVYHDVPWLVFKGQTSARLQGNYTRMMKPPIRNPNAATGALYDLLSRHPGPASVTVYGCDLYAAGPHGLGMYHDRYLDDTADILEGRHLDLSRHAFAFLAHRPWDQMRLHRLLVETGRVVGDDRYLAAVSMTDDEYQAVIDAWQAVLEEAPV